MNFSALMTMALINWKTKVGSLIMAFFLFAYVQYSRNITRVIQVRVDPPRLASDFILNGPVPAFMNVRLSGPRDVMDFPVRDLRITLSNTKKKATRGSNTFLAKLEPELPTGVNASYRLKVPVELDFERTRRLPVVPDFEVNLDSGFERGYTYVEPSSIRVTGPAEIVGSMDRVATLKTKLDGRKRNVIEDTLLIDLPNYVSVEPGQPIEVKVYSRITPIIDDTSQAADPSIYRFDDLQLKCVNAPRNISLVTFTAVSAFVKIADPAVVERLELEGRVFCPVYFDDDEEVIRPFREIQNLPVQLVTGNGETIDVLTLKPSRVRLRFEREAPTKRPRREIKKGFEQHIFNP